MQVAHVSDRFVHVAGVVHAVHQDTFNGEINRHGGGRCPDKVVISKQMESPPRVPDGRPLRVWPCVKEATASPLSRGSPLSFLGKPGPSYLLDYSGCSAAEDVEQVTRMKSD